MILLKRIFLLDTLSYQNSQQLIEYVGNTKEMCTIVCTLLREMGALFHGCCPRRVFSAVFSVAIIDMPVVNAPTAPMSDDIREDDLQNLVALVKLFRIYAC